MTNTHRHRRRRLLRLPATPTEALTTAAVLLTLGTLALAATAGLRIAIALLCLLVGIPCLGTVLLAVVCLLVDQAAALWRRTRPNRLNRLTRT